MQTMALPLCHNCPAEVKPGEDLCWDCLGETLESEWESYTVYGADAAGNALVYGAYEINVASGPIQWAATTTMTVTGLAISGGTEFTFSPISVIEGDSISFTISGTLFT